ncbi:MAG: LptF/LptG family permease, partial [Pseudomonadota bacterium]
TNIDIATIENSFRKPKTLSVWQLPSYIQQLDLAGFNSVRHNVRLWEMMFRPFLITAMALLGFAFGCYLDRFQTNYNNQIFGFILCFMAYAINQIFLSSATSGIMLEAQAVALPIVIALLIAVVRINQFEMNH